MANAQYQRFLDEWNNADRRVLVRTSGSTGTPKEMWAEKRRMEASARATCQFLGLHEGDSALLCMSTDYIAGKMMVVRALTCGLQIVCVEPSGHPLQNMVRDGLPAPTFAAMVPMQVWNTLQVPAEEQLLRDIRQLIIGGGAIDARLSAALHAFPHAVWSTYGMTETLSHIAMRRLNGPEASTWYTPLPGVGVALSDMGTLVIDAPHVCPERLVTNDLAELSGDGRFRILGRRDNVIVTGGVKVQAEEIEARLRQRLPALSLAVTSVPDEKFGERIVLLVESKGDEKGGSQDQCHQALHSATDELPKYWQPKSIFFVPHLPLTETGKTDRAAVRRLAQSFTR